MACKVWEVIMSQDLRAVSKFPHFKVFTANTNATEILLPSQCSKVTIGSQASPLFVGQNDCTDGDAMPSDKMFVPSNNSIEIKIGRGNSRATSVFIAAQSGTASVAVVLEET